MGSGNGTIDFNNMSPLQQAVWNALLMSRSSLVNMGPDRRRDVYEEAGYPRAGEYIDPWVYKELWEREAVAARAVEVLPKESWQVQPTVYETEDPCEVTPFERAWDGLGKTLRGQQSWYKEEEGSPVWEYLLRADVLSGVGSYGVILLGVDDGEDDMSLPLAGFTEENSVPDETEQPRDADGKATGPKRVKRPPTGNAARRFRPYSLTVNKEQTRGRKLLYLRVFPEHLAEVTAVEANRTSPRYGQPTRYLLTLNDTNDRAQGAGIAASSLHVHWSRVIHVADVGYQASASDVYAVPRLRPVLNECLGLKKLSAAHPEGYWKACYTLLSFETHPQLGGDVDINRTEMRDTFEKMMNGLERYGAFAGGSLKSIAPAVVDPTPHVDALINQICIKLGVPVRVFKGSERGELASSQDDAAWNDRLRERQRNYVTPRIVVPFVDRLIACGVLPEPKYKPEVEFPEGGRPEQAIDPRTGKPRAVRSGFDPELKGADDELTPAADDATGSGAPSPRRKTRPGAPAGNARPPGLAGRGGDPEADDPPVEFPRDEEQEGEPDGDDPASGEMADPSDEEPGYHVDWPDLTSQTEIEKAEVAEKKINAISAAIAGNVTSMIPEEDILTQFLGFADDEARSMLDAAAEQKAARDEEEVAKQQDLIAKGLMPDPVKEQEAKIQALKGGKPAAGFGGGGAGGPPKPGGGFPPKPSLNEQYATDADVLAYLDGLLGEGSDPAANVFCATGEGGGVDPTCSPGDDGSLPKVYGVWNDEVGPDRYSRRVSQTDKLFEKVVRQKTAEATPGEEWPFPPVKVKRDASGPPSMQDGHHRVEVAKRLGVRIIPAELVDVRAFGHTKPVNTFVEIGDDGDPRVIQPNNESLPPIRVIVPERAKKDHGLLADNYDPNQPRDEGGKWTDTGAGGGKYDKTDDLINSPEVLKELKVPEVMYHVTDRSRLADVMKEGIRVGSARGTDKGEIRGVYLTDVPSADALAKEGGDFRFKDPVVIKVSTKGLSLRLDPEYFYYDNKTREGALAYVRAVNEREEMFALYSRASIPPSALEITDNKFDPNQPRDPGGEGGGQWVSGGAAGGAAGAGQDGKGKHPGFPPDKELAGGVTKDLKPGGEVRKVSTGGKDYVVKQRGDTAENGKLEELVSDLAEEAGVRMPKSKMTTVGGQPALVSDWVTGAPASELRKKDPGGLQKALAKHKDDLDRHAMFDYLLGHSDVHEGNYMVGEGGITAIDKEFVLKKGVRSQRFTPPKILSLAREDGNGDNHPFDPKNVKEMAAAGKKLAATLKSRGMDRESREVEDRAVVLARLASEANPTAGTLYALGRQGVTPPDKGAFGKLMWHLSKGT